MNDIGFRPVFAGRKGRRYHIQVDVDIKYNLPCDDSRMFVPLLSCTDNRRELPALLLVGGNRYRSLRDAFGWWSFRRVLSSYNIKKVLKSDSSTIRYRYRVSLDYENWMEKANLSLGIAGG